MWLAGSRGGFAARDRRSSGSRRSDRPRARAGTADPRSFAALLDVRLDELLGVLLEDRVDLVQDVVHLLLELLALGGGGHLAGLVVRAAAGTLLGFFLLLLLRHSRAPSVRHRFYPESATAPSPVGTVVPGRGAQGAVRVGPSGPGSATTGASRRAPPRRRPPRTAGRRAPSCLGVARASARAAAPRPPCRR